jgi:RNA polymerase sigma-70 factor (ECF subfamily)
MILNKKLNEIHRLCCENNSIAQKRLYEFYYGPMISICMRYCKNNDDAIEVLNTGFFKVFKHIKTFSGNEDDLFSWIYKIMVNSCIDKIRRNIVANKNLVDVNLEIYKGKADNNAISNFGVSDLVKMIQKLPKKSRMVFNLYVFENRPHKEIAKILNITDSTSQWHLLNARKILKRKINALTEYELRLKI